MRKVRIAFFAEVLIREYDGATRTMFQIIDRFDRDLYEVLFFCAVPPNEDLGYKVYKVPSFTIPMNKDYRMATTFRSSSKIEEKLKEFRPDVIHIASPSMMGHFALKQGIKNDIPVTSIYHTHYISYVQYYTKNLPLITPAIKKAAIRQSKSFYNRCTRVYVPTDAIAQELEDYGFKRSVMRLWPRGVDLELFNPDKKDKSCLPEEARNGYKNILFASRLVYEKNLDLLVDIYNLILEQDLPFNLIIAGAGVALENMHAKMPEAIFLGNVDHGSLAPLYATCDYFLFTSITETYGNVISEAMASNLPCIIAKGGGSQSLVKEGITGYLCDPKQPQDFIDRILSLENYPDTRALMTMTAYKEAQKLNWDDLVNDLLEEFDSLSRPNYAEINALRIPQPISN